MSYKEFRIQLKDAVTGESIITAGGTVYVATANAAKKLTLFSDAIGTSLANPMTPTRGFLNFFVQDTVDVVDLYILAPGGQFLVAKGIKPSGPNEIYIDTGARMQDMVIPFDISDTSAATETDTGFNLPAKAVALPHPFVDVLTIDATETIDFGTLTGESGDPDGYMDGVSVATLGIALATLTNGSATLGVLFSVQDSINAGDLVPEADITGQGKSLSYTLSAGTDTAAGFIHQPYVLGG